MKFATIVPFGLLCLHLLMTPIHTQISWTNPVGKVSCGDQVKSLVDIYLKQIEGVPKPAGTGDNATILSKEKLHNYIKMSARDLATDCENVGASRTQYLTTEVEAMGDGSLVIYQIGIQRIDFEKPTN